MVNVKLVSAETSNQTSHANNCVILPTEYFIFLVVTNHHVGKHTTYSQDTAPTVFLWLFPIKWWEGGCPFKTRAIFCYPPRYHSHPGESSGALTLSINHFVSSLSVMESWPIQCTESTSAGNMTGLGLTPDSAISGIKKE